MWTSHPLLLKNVTTAPPTTRGLTLAKLPQTTAFFLFLRGHYPLKWLKNKTSQYTKLPYRLQWHNLHNSLQREIHFLNCSTFLISQRGPSDSSPLSESSVNTSAIDCQCKHIRRSRCNRSKWCSLLCSSCVCGWHQCTIYIKRLLSIDVFRYNLLDSSPL